MPYIKEVDRTYYAEEINSLVDKFVPMNEDLVKGHLNYVIFSVINGILKGKGMTYARAQDLIGGTLTCCQLELYRRLMSPYEDKKCEENTDVI